MTSTLQLTIDKKDLSCPVCTDFLTEPLQLSCSHFLCMNCIVNLCLNSKNGKVLCPQCKKQFNPHKLTSNTFLKNGIQELEIETGCGEKILIKNKATHEENCTKCQYYIISDIKRTLDKCIIETFTPEQTVDNMYLGSVNIPYSPINNSSSHLIGNALSTLLNTYNH